MKRKNSQKLIELIGNSFKDKKERNPQYSYRAFARDLGISQSLLVKVLDGSRTATPELALRLGLHLELADREIVELAVSTFAQDSDD
jgi:plasmid maintenance system antidote protein VapI